MEKKIKIVFLYTELASYFLSCLDELLLEDDLEVHLVRWPLNSEAPFDFKFNPLLNVYDRKSFNKGELETLVDKIQPDLIYSSGWVDKTYKRICRKYKKSIPVIVGMDNQWEGTFKQKLAIFLSPFIIKKYFNKAWVPGEKQKYFAKRLGFKEQDILTGFYSADVNFFNKYYETFKREKNENYPKRFIYVGRYLSFKGINELWEAFIEMQNENPSEWELWCLGTGAEYDNRKEHEKIKHFGFVQPEEISNFIRQSGVFILPSTFEPWGVVIHEFAASGFPIITTDRVGAASSFVINNKNGFIVPAGNKNELKKAMLYFTGLSNKELNKMSEESHHLGQSINPTVWKNKLLELLK